MIPSSLPLEAICQVFMGHPLQPAARTWILPPPLISYVTLVFFVWFFGGEVVFCLFRAAPWHMEVPRIAVKSEL